MQEVLSAAEVGAALERIGQEVAARNPQRDHLVVVGIHTRGYFLGLRLAEQLHVPSGSLDIALYRDDLNRRLVQPVLKRTDIPFAIENRTVLLVDDVLFTGRTIRAALDALADFGRPSSIQLAVLVEREGRELPIQADYVGCRVDTRRDQRVFVKVREHDGEDRVVIQDEPNEGKG